MAVFDPNDWWGQDSWFGSSAAREKRRTAGELNRETVQRWLTSVAFCLCFASLGPVGLFTKAFAGLLIVAALASIAVAILRREQPLSPHLTSWDEAALSLALSLGLMVWPGSPP